MGKKIDLPEKQLKQFDLVVSMIPEIERKGKGSPYTSMNGNMYTMMRKDGVLGIRLSKEDRIKFMEEHGSEPFENYGSMIKDYVTVPDQVLMNTDLMVAYLKRSHEYTKTLPKKATTKKKTTTTKKSVTHDLGAYYKNGQIKSELKDDQLMTYFEDGSIKSKGQVVDDKMEGQWVFNRKGGQLLQVGHYKEDIKNGEWIRYDSKGEITYHVVFKNGKVIEKLY